MAIESVVHVRMNGRLGGKDVVTALAWFAELKDPAITGFDIVNAFYTDIWTTWWKPIVSASYTLETLVGYYSDEENGSGASHTFVANEAGGVTASESLPGYVTLNIFKIPDNDTLTPDTAEPFGRGFFGVSGIPEAYQNAGIVDSVSITGYQELADNMLEMSVFDGATLIPYTLGIWRSPPLPASDNYVMCESLQASQILGIRRSRRL